MFGWSSLEMSNIDWGLGQVQHRFRCRTMTPYHQSSPSPCGKKHMSWIWKMRWEKVELFGITGFNRQGVSISSHFSAHLPQQKLTFSLAQPDPSAYEKNATVHVNKQRNLYSPVPLFATSVICGKGLLKSIYFWARKSPLFSASVTPSALSSCREHPHHRSAAT